MKQLSELSQNDFDALMNQKFMVTPNGWKDTVEIELVQTKNRSTGLRDCCTMIFKGPQGDLFPHNIHRVEHPKLGQMDLFLGPTNYRKNDAVYYLMVLNRSKTKKID